MATFPSGKVSVITSVKDGAAFIALAVESILTQTYSNLEFIIINDGSSDDTDTLLKGYTDQRIQYISHKTSRGLPVCLNEAISLATGTYIARMDADDIALPTRLEKQVQFLEMHPTIDLVGTWARVMDENGRIGEEIYRTPITEEEVLFRACFANPFIHPSIMLRAPILKANAYDETYTRSQDFELWSRLLFMVGAKGANIAEPLVQYRRHAASLTKQKQPKEYLRSALIALQNMQAFYQPTPEEKDLFLASYAGQRLPFKSILRRMRLSFSVRDAFIAIHPRAKATLKRAPWKDLWFFTKYWIKQLIRPKVRTRVTPNAE